MTNVAGDAHYKKIGQYDKLKIVFMYNVVIGDK